MSSWVVLLEIYSFNCPVNQFEDARTQTSNVFLPAAPELRLAVTVVCSTVVTVTVFSSTEVTVIVVISTVVTVTLYCYCS